MPTYILLSNLTAQGVQTLKSNPARLREVNKDVEELGARVLHQWATLGPFDFVNVVEAPDAATIARVSIALGARESEAPDADGARDRGVPGRRDLGLAGLIGDRDLGREPRVRDHELAVDAERSPAASLVQA